MSSSRPSAYDIKSLLNPAPEPQPTRAQQTETPRSSPSPATPISIPDISGRRPNEALTFAHRNGSVSHAGRPKLVKDNAIFVEGTPKGPVRFKPYEIFPDEVVSEMKALDFKPELGKIGTYPRRIPYSSDRRDFQDKTGRDAFEVFQFTFQIPGESKPYLMMWDYNTGLVRTTALFKCYKFSKTVPAKMLNSNPGLKDISHSITGGAIAAQGYWMPYAAARAIAATFCWEIRHVLVPLFGLEFLDMCIPPGQRGHNVMLIPKQTIAECTAEAAAFKEYELNRKLVEEKGDEDTTPPTFAKVPSKSEKLSPSPSPWGTPINTSRDIFRAIPKIEQTLTPPSSSKGDEEDAMDYQFTRAMSTSSTSTSVASLIDPESHPTHPANVLPALIHPGYCTSTASSSNTSPTSPCFSPASSTTAASRRRLSSITSSAAAYHDANRSTGSLVITSEPAGSDGGERKRPVSECSAAYTLMQLHITNKKRDEQEIASRLGKVRSGSLARPDRLSAGVIKRYTVRRGSSSPA